MGQDPRQAIVDKNRLNFGMGTQGNPYKKGGKVAHPDEAADRQLIKKMVKPSARTGKDVGGPAKGYKGAMLQKEGKDYWTPQYMMEAKMGQQEADDPTYNKGQGPTRENAARMEYLRKQEDMKPSYMKKTEGSSSEGPPYASSENPPHFPEKRGGRAEHCWGGEAKPKKRKEGGGVFSGPNYPGKVPGVVPGGRMARKSGGKAMTVNVIVAGKEKPAGMTPPAGMMPPGGPPPGARPPVSVPPPQPLAPAAGAPAPMQAPMPQQGAPMGRKHGGRTFHSYKDMTAGSASGEGRLEKSDIAAYKKRK
jgi:hypothetical protein